jgi:glycosyltransferase involved in cell wall biosynthesis
MKLKVAILDMQPITPAVGGGRLRLLGLYHALGATIDARYVGTYDWPGEKYRKHRVSSGLEETTIPLSAEHHKAAAALAAQANGKNVIDLAFHNQAYHSPEFVHGCREVIAWADVIVFSHPWVYPLVQGDLRVDQAVVYDSHNVEGLLRAQLLNESHAVEREILRELVRVECELCRRADWVFTCSREDLGIFATLYSIGTERIRVVPNGVMSDAIKPPSRDEKVGARTSLGIDADRRVAIFIGSDYPPNVAAARFILDGLARSLPDISLVVAGGVGARLTCDADNVIITGPISDEMKLRWLHASDLALNPMARERT